MAVTLLIDGREVALANAEAESENLWLPISELESATGWHLEPEGLCRDERCVPIPRDSGMTADDRVNVAAFTRHLGQPVVHTDDGDVWAVGSEAPMSGLAMPVRPAPDFSLPDGTGRGRQLSEWHGKKVFLAAWASW